MTPIRHHNRHRSIKRGSLTTDDGSLGALMRLHSRYLLMKDFQTVPILQILHQYNSHEFSRLFFLSAVWRWKVQDPLMLSRCQLYKNGQTVFQLQFLTKREQDWRKESTHQEPTSLTGFRMNTLPHCSGYFQIHAVVLLVQYSDNRLLLSDILVFSLAVCC